jgi:hypothetical protein
MRRAEAVCRLALWAVLAAALAFSSCGCTGKFTRQRYDTVYIGQPAGDVERTLGKPEVRAGDQWLYVNRRPAHYEARILFDLDRKVVRKEWFDRKELFKY